VGTINHILKSVVCRKKPDKQHLFTLDEAAAVQERTLRYLIRRAKITAFGEHYQFSKILESKEYLNLFCNQVPIHTYNDMYVRWWYRSLNGETYVTWPGKIKYYITKNQYHQITGKTIPVSREIMRSYLIAGKRYLSMCSDKQVETLQSKLPSLDFYKTYYGGSLAGILSHHNPLKYQLCLANCFAFENSNYDPDFLLTDTGLVGLRQNKSNSFRLIVDNNLFYEFLPYNNAEVLDKKTLKDLAKKTNTLKQIENGKDYILFLTNNSGAWRYFTEQVVQFTDIEKLEFMVSGKVKVSK